MLPLLRRLRGHDNLLRAFLDFFAVLDSDEVLTPRNRPCKDFMLPLVALAEQHSGFAAVQRHIPSTGSMVPLLCLTSKIG